MNHYKSINALNQSMKEEAAKNKVTSDKLRREIMEKKSQIDILERDASKVDEIRSYLSAVIEDFQYSTQFKLYSSPEDLQKIIKDPTEGIKLLKNGIDQLIDKNIKLSRRFENEMNKNLSELNNELKKAQVKEQKQIEEVHLAEAENCHLHGVIIFLTSEKAILQRTVLMRNSALERHLEQDENAKQKMYSQIQETEEQLNSARRELGEQKRISARLIQREDDRRGTEEEQIMTYYELKQKAENLRKAYKDESYKHNCCQADLTSAKSELQRLSNMVGSYGDNLKTQQLITEEAENRRQHSIYRIEREEWERKFNREAKKTSELERKVAELVKRVSQLNTQISSTEQKLQTQLMKIPDFAQLHQALDRSLALSKKYSEQVLKQKYMLDEIREKNFAMEEMERNESKARTIQWLQPLPSDIQTQKKEEEASANEVHLNDLSAEVEEFMASLRSIGIQ